MQCLGEQNELSAASRFTDSSLNKDAETKIGCMATFESLIGFPTDRYFML